MTGCDGRNSRGEGKRVGRGKIRSNDLYQFFVVKCMITLQTASDVTAVSGDPAPLTSTK